MFAWMLMGYGNTNGVSFRLGLYFLCPVQFLTELVHHKEWNWLQPSTPFTTVDHPGNTLF